MAMRIVTEKAVSQRKIRRPQHSFQLRFRPWQIQPFMIAPVVPGETMRNLLLQARVVSDPIDNALVGWWYESYFFYVKLRDLDGRADFENMLMDPDWADVATYQEAASVPYYHGWSTINWTKLCLKRVVEEYFRADGEGWDDYLIDGMPACGINRDSWADSLVTDTLYAATIVPEETLTVGVDDAITASEIHDLMTKWEWQKAHGLVTGELTFEDWLVMQGVRVPAADDEENRYRPELIRFVRNWTYPTNTVDPTTGAPTSAVSWAITERADKDRFFTEPGFIIGVNVARPKVYLSKQSGSAVGLLTDAERWLPSLLNDPTLGMIKSTAMTGLVPTSTDDYWVDVADLFLYGDQFVNFALTETNAGMVALPTAALQKRYPASTDADGLFKTKTAGLGVVKADGVVSMMIASRLRDRTGTV